MAGVASVVDGLTIEIHGQRVRLFGIDAPESSHLCVRPKWRALALRAAIQLALADRTRDGPL
jgi:endonuclease YncB( thermonuclease family)